MHIMGFFGKKHENFLMDDNNYLDFMSLMLKKRIKNRDLGIRTLNKRNNSK